MKKIFDYYIQEIHTKHTQRGNYRELTYAFSMCDWLNKKAGYTKYRVIEINWEEEE